MRIVIDLQACQSAGSRFRGIGRYSRSLAEAMLRQDRGHEFWIALNGAQAEPIEAIRAAFDGLLPQERIVAWDNPFAAVEHLDPDPWRSRVAERIREDFLAALRPDVVHLSSLFEGWDDVVATSIGRGAAPVPTAVTLYDLIPLAMPALYLQDPPTKRWYERKLEDLRRADLCLAISDFSRTQGIDLLDLEAARVANISGACDPVFRRLPADPARDAALRARHGLWRPYVMYTGGFDPRKNVPGLVRAFAALPGELRARHQLLVVGEPPAPIRVELEALVRDLALPADAVRFAGFVDDPDLVALYNACALYVFPSTCEGFGLPALEAMACGAPVIAADASSLPEVIGHPESMFAPGSVPAMGAKIAQALQDEEFRARLLAHGAERASLFSWEESARRAMDAIEARFGANRARAAGAGADRDAAIAVQSAALSRLMAGRTPPHDADRRIAAAQSLNFPLPARRPQLLVDISNLVAHDARTGIQRVVRNILRELATSPPGGFDVEPLWFDEAGVCRYARTFLHRMLGRPGEPPADALVDPRPGDVFLGLDLSAHIVPGHAAQFARWRAQGVRLHFVVYDLVPVLRPDVVNPLALHHFDRWYPAIAGLADGLCCISRAVADDLLEWCDQARPPRLRPLRIGHFHLGGDLDATDAGATDATGATGARNASDAADAPSWLAARQTVLMVGTLEPRKGYAQSLAAAERLWQRGVDFNLAIVGKPGWLMEDFAQALRAHPEHGARLHWLDTADDTQLLALYRGSSGLLVASEAEGFGLPIIEGARHGLPVLARDLRVFREVAGGHAGYFSGHSADALADALARWLDAVAAGRAPASAGLPCLGWRESTAQLLDCVLGGAWDAAWLPGPRHRFPANDPRMQHQVGVREREAWRSDGRAGFLTYGPYARLPAGRYALRAHGAWSAPGEAWLDVVLEQGRHPVLHQPQAPGAAGADGLLADATLVLDVDATDLEIRLWVAADAGLRLDGFELRRDASS
jgi:glycosyltransferase involved in cell wall biosynthesis